MKKIHGGICAPRGFLTAAVKAGIKKADELDLCCIYSPFPCAVGSVFTVNRFKSSSILYSKANLKSSGHTAHLIVANSGVANTGVGPVGETDCRLIGQTAAGHFDVAEKHVLIASTGKIGVPLPMKKIIPRIGVLKEKLGNNNGMTARAIMTTDTVPKTYAVNVTINNSIVRIGGVAKGSGMINPDMATMLSFITTDVNMPQPLLQKTLAEAVDESFNSITVDGDMSPNDTVFVLANGRARNRPIEKTDSRGYKVFCQALTKVMLELARLIVKDGEGATKFITLKINNARSAASAKRVGKAIAHSPLVKTAFFGEDFNWGRIISAIGSAGEPVAMEKVKLYLFRNLIYSQNRPRSFDQDKMRRLLKKDAVTLTVDLGARHGYGTVIYTTDLSYDYVKINAEYST